MTYFPIEMNSKKYQRKNYKYKMSSQQLSTKTIQLKMNYFWKLIAVNFMHWSQILDPKLKSSLAITNVIYLYGVQDAYSNQIIYHKILFTLSEPITFNKRHFSKFVKIFGKI